MVRILSVALVTAFFVGTNTAHAENVILYQAIDGFGRPLQFEEGNVPEMGRGWNDAVSSFWLRNGYRFEGYEAINFQGASFVVVAPANGHAPEVSRAGFTYRQVNGGWLVNIHKDGWNDVLSSYKVSRVR